jgi:hypothetical protein
MKGKGKGLAIAGIIIPIIEIIAYTIFILVLVL